MSLYSPFPTRYVDRTDADYQKVPWYHFVLLPGKNGSGIQDFIRSSGDLQSALEVKSIPDSVPHSSAEGRELSVELLKEVISNIVSGNDADWVAGCDSLLVIHHPNKEGKLISAMANLLVSSRSGGGKKMLSIHQSDRNYSFEINLHPNEHVAQGRLIFVLVNPVDPAVVRLVERDRGGIFRFTNLYATKQNMETFAFDSLRLNVSHSLGIPSGDIEGKYEPLRESTYPDFEMSIDGKEWAVEVARVESGMTSYVEVDGRFNQRGFNQAFRNHITDARVAEALWKEIGEKAQIRSKCSSYSRHCLLLVDIVDAVGANGTPVWNGCDLSTFDVVAVVKMDGSGDYIKEQFASGSDF